jgi:hypothetical protein
MKQYFKIGGVGGYIIAVLGLVATAIILVTISVKVQQTQATNFYSLDTSINGLKANGNNQQRFYKLEGK